MTLPAKWLIGCCQRLSLPSAPDRLSLASSKAWPKVSRRLQSFSLDIWPIAFLAVLLLFALIYYLAPNTDQRSWRWVTAGSVAGASAWVALSGLFALYTSFSNSYTKTYGTLAAGIILLLWLNYSAWAILFGAELNAQLDRQEDIHAAGGEHAGLIKPVRRTR